MPYFWGKPHSRRAVRVILRERHNSVKEASITAHRYVEKFIYHKYSSNTNKFKKKLINKTSWFCFDNTNSIRGWLHFKLKTNIYDTFKSNLKKFLAYTNQTSAEALLSLLTLKFLVTESDNIIFGILLTKLSTRRLRGNLST